MLYVDSTGLGELAQSYVAARIRGGKVELLNVPDQVKYMLAVARLLPMFECFEREVEALASFLGSPPPE